MEPLQEVLTQWSKVLNNFTHFLVFDTEGKRSTLTTPKVSGLALRMRKNEALFQVFL